MTAGSGHAASVRAAREASGKDVGEIATALGLSFEAYRDLEWFDDEITSVVSFRDVVKLGEVLDLDVRRMFGAGTEATATFDDLAAALRARLAETPLEQLEDDLGWELAAPLADPTAFADFTLDGLADVATPLGIDWRHLLPA